MQENTQPSELETKTIDDDGLPVESYFFTTSTLKLTLMSICTFGLYEIYWFYYNWVLIKEQTEKNMMPFWRAFFAPLWAYKFIEHIKAVANKHHIEESLSVLLLAVGYFIAHGLQKLPDPYWLITFFSVVFLIPVNNVAIKINKHFDPDFQNNDKFTAWNWLALVLGGSLFVLSIIGLFLPEA